MKALKKIVPICLLALALVISITLLTPKAEAASESDLTFTLNSDGNSYMVSGCDQSASGELVIPETYYGKPVTTIGGAAFNCCKNLTSVTIPDSVTTIGDYAFNKCCSLTGIWVDAENCNYFSDRNGVLYNKDMTTLIQAPGAITGHYTIPDSVTTIGDRAFSDCTSLTSVTIPDSVTSVGQYAFYDCDSLTYNIYDNAKYLGNEDNPYVVLMNTASDSITSCEIHPNTKIIFDFAFSGCSSLISITIPDGVTTIGNYAFWNCRSLTGITIPDSVTTISSSAFKGCSSLTGITIPDSVTSIGYSAFEGCTSLTAITIPDGVTSIGGSAFYDCDSLESVTIPDSVTTIGNSAFDNCRSLTYNIYDNAKYLGNEDNPYVVLMNTASDSITSCEIHPNTKIVYDSAFSYCSSLTSVTIPDSVTTIGNSAFDNCFRLTGIWVDANNPNYCNDENGVLFTKDMTTLLQAPGAITGHYTIPNSVITIGNSEFYNCSSLTSVTIPDSVTTIGNWAFDNCDSLTSVTIGDSVTTIGESAFYYCSSLQNVYYAGTQSQWNSISIGTDNENLTNATIHYNHIHNYSLIPPVTVDATCTEEGYIEYTCMYGETYRETIPALGHSKGENAVVIAPTCEEQGYTKSNCSRCGVEAKTDYTSALGHDFSGEQTVVAPTCTAQGYTETKCTRCDYTQKSAYTDSLGHDFSGEQTIVAPTCTAQGYTETKCTRCDATEKSNYTEAVGHNVVVIAVKDPTCTEQGVSKVGTMCDRCKEVFIQPTYTEALGHSFTNYTGNNDAACTVDGTKTAKCDRCDATETVTDTGSALGHDYVDGVCSRCQETDPDYAPQAKPGDMTGDKEINNDDVVLLLWHTLFPEDYPLNVSGDINKDSQVNNDDVVLLLWHTLFPEDYPL